MKTLYDHRGGGRGRIAGRFGAWPVLVLRDIDVVEAKAQKGDRLHGEDRDQVSSVPHFYGHPGLPEGRDVGTGDNRAAITLNLAARSSASSKTISN